MTYRRMIVVGCSLGALYGLFWSAMAVAAAWSHNPQEMYHGDGQSFSGWLDLAEIAVLWLVVKGAPVAAVLSAAGCALLAVRRPRRS